MENQTNQRLVIAPSFGRVQKLNDSDVRVDHPTNTQTSIVEGKDYKAASFRGACSTSRPSPPTGGLVYQNTGAAPGDCSISGFTHLNNRSGNIQISCLQINLKHKRAATSNLMHIIDTYKVDIILIQEPYILRNKLAGITSKYKIFSQGENRIRAAILLANERIDGVLLKQLSDEDVIAIEILHNNLKFYMVSMYMDITADINNDFAKLDKILNFTKDAGVILSIDSNSRSTTWHDVITNSRGRNVDEYMSSKRLYILNEPSEYTTFESNTGKSNIDLTVTNGKLVSLVKDWQCGGEESCSDHRFITFKISEQQTYNAQKIGVKYIIKHEKLSEFNNHLIKELSEIIPDKTKIDTTDDLDTELSRLVYDETNIETLVRDYEEAITAACKKSFRISNSTRKQRPMKSVPWWTEELTILRKRTNATRRRYQKTKNNQALREQRRNSYLQAKREYESTINKEKIRSWKQYCTLTTSGNPWNAAYQIASGKLRKPTPLTTLRKTDGSLTSGLHETLQLMIDYFVPQDEQGNDNNHHKQIRAEIREPMSTQDDSDFTLQEIRQIIENMDPKKTPGDDGITSKILSQVV